MKKKLYNNIQHILYNTKKSIEDHCDDVLINTQSSRQPDGKIHPSSIGSCPRRIFFFMKKVPYTDNYPHSAQLQRIFDMGVDHELRMKRTLRLANILVDVDVPIPDNNDRVSGVCDAVVLLDNEYVVCEIKTANDFSFKNSIPHLNYKYQTACYMIYLNLNSGIIFYQNKNDSSQVEIFINKSDSIINEVQELIKFYNYNFDNNILPDVTTIKPTCTNKSCPYFTKCSSFSEFTQTISRI